ncbi:DUF5305 domain-containing protein [Haloferax sp. DFSO52]|uniref:DUF5305 domain-containing protein n=1 Tax=Haloferax sp. DFSO52 TaxID=3388505 RepID=UPI003A8B6A79
MALEDRIELFVTRQARPLVALFAVVGLLCLVGAGYVFFTPSTQTVTDEVNVQTIESSVETSAVATGESSLYDQGETLENKSAYFTQIAPVVSFHVNTTVPSDQPVLVTQRLTMETVGVRDGDPFYRSTRTLIEDQQRVSDGRVAAAQSINVTAMRDELETKRSETDGLGRFQVTLTLDVTYQTDSYEGTITTSAPFVISGQAYYLDGAVSDSKTHSTTVTRRVQEPSDPLEYSGLAFLGFVLLGLCGLIIRTEDNSDPEVLRTEISHSRHDEWISRGEFPTESEKQYISIRTLEDLVDVAIDTNRRVIYDPDIDIYAVIDGTEIYYYSTDDLHAHTWLNL